MRLCEVSKTPDEGRVAVQALGPPDTTLGAQLLGLVNHLLVDFEQRLDVVGCEGYGNEHQVLLPLFDKVFDCVAGLRA